MDRRPIEVAIDASGQVVYVYNITDIANAGWIGFEFARNNPDLVGQGWMLYYYDDHPVGHGSKNEFSLTETSPGTISGAIAKLIHGKVQ